MADVFAAPACREYDACVFPADYVLVDGSRRAQAESRLYELFDSPEFRNLFDGTRWAPIRQVAPILVRTEPQHPGLRQLLAELQEYECGYLIASHASLDSLATHMRCFIEARHPLGHLVLLRFADPSVARVLLSAPHEGGVPAYWAELKEVCLPDRLWGGWHLEKRPDFRTGKLYRQSGAMFCQPGELTCQQLAAVDQRSVLVRLLRHLETWFPARIAEKPRAGVIAGLRTLMEEAVCHGYTSLQALTHWCTVFGYLGHPGRWALEAPDIHRILHTRPAETGAAEARKAALLAREQVQAFR